MVHRAVVQKDNILTQIVTHKVQEISQRRALKPVQELIATMADLEPCRPFGKALRQPGEVALIAEIKGASPSKGIIRHSFDPVDIAGRYAHAGAVAISVLTDAKFFAGSPDYLAAVRKKSALPLLMKDFMISDYQLYEARVLGADAVLLIAAVLADEQLADFLNLAGELGLDCLVEVHDQNELERALAVGADIIGINNRNLKTFTTSIEQTFELLPLISLEVTVVSESGIKTRADMQRLAAAGVHAALVGETLMAHPDPGEKARELLGLTLQSGVSR